MVRCIYRRPLLALCNFVFLLCGLFLIGASLYLLTDKQRLLLSHIAFSSQPFFVYVIVGLAIAGGLLISGTILGYFAFYTNNYCLFAVHFLFVLLLLVLECGTCIAIMFIRPQCLALTMNATAMVKILQGRYGVPGHEEFTIGMDLAQTVFECCAMNSNVNYDTSLWRLQSLGQKDWVVPLSCCHLQNKQAVNSYLDPQPANLTQCQSLRKEDYDKSRHLEGCLDKIEQWYHRQHVVLLAIGLAIAVVAFAVLLAIMLNCTKMRDRPPRPLTVQRIAKSDVGTEPESFRYDQTAVLEHPIYVQPPDLHKHKHITTFKPVSRYEIQRSLLV